MMHLISTKWLTQASIVCHAMQPPDPTCPISFLSSHCITNWCNLLRNNKLANRLAVCVCVCVCVRNIGHWQQQWCWMQWKQRRGSAGCVLCRRRRLGSMPAAPIAELVCQLQSHIVHHCRLA